MYIFLFIGTFQKKKKKKFKRFLTNTHFTYLIGNFTRNRKCLLQNKITLSKKKKYLLSCNAAVCSSKGLIFCLALCKRPVISWTDLFILAISLYTSSKASFTSRNAAIKFSLISRLRFSIWLLKFRLACNVFSV